MATKEMVENWKMDAYFDNLEIEWLKQSLGVFETVSVEKKPEEKNLEHSELT
jgi:hypothetical protein